MNNILANITDFSKADLHPFLEISTYPDDIKYINWSIFNGWHYVTEPYIPKELKSRINEIKNSELSTPKENIVWAINQMKKTLRNDKISLVDDHFPKSFSLMMLIHLVGDIH